MSAENVEFMKARLPVEIDMVELFRSDGTAFADSLQAVSDLETVFISGNPDAAAPTFTGVDGLAAGWRDWLVPYESYRLRVVDYVDAGDDVIIRVKAMARTNRDGVVIEHEAAAVWTIKDLRLVRVCFYLDPADVLPAEV